LGQTAVLILEKTNPGDGLAAEVFNGIELEVAVELDVRDQPVVGRNRAVDSVGKERTAEAKRLQRPRSVRDDLC